MKGSKFPKDTPRLTSWHLVKFNLIHKNKSKEYDDFVSNQGRGGPPGLGIFPGRPLKTFYKGLLDSSSFHPFIICNFKFYRKNKWSKAPTLLPRHLFPTYYKWWQQETIRIRGFSSAIDFRKLYNGPLKTWFSPSIKIPTTPVCNRRKLAYSMEVFQILFSLESVVEFLDISIKGTTLSKNYLCIFKS